MQKQSPAYITFPLGYSASGLHCGLKKNDAPDLALIISDCPAQFAGIYTTNLVKGHSLTRTIQIENQQAYTRGVTINSGNANACVGPDGLTDADQIATSVSKALTSSTRSQNTPCSPNDILTCSTGVIGQRLPTKKILSAVDSLVSELSTDETAGHRAMSAIMTTDLVPKESAVSFTIDGKEVRLAGMAKGSGMIHPNMATMISVLTTDATIQAPLLKKSLKKVADKSFHRITVDGDTSVCDTLLVFANGCSGTAEILESTPEYDLFLEALSTVCIDLARGLAKDGEGATKLVDVQITGAPTQKDALLILTAICRSPLCKTMFYGEDANIGRLMTAAGYSGADFNPDLVDLYIGDLPVLRQGVALPFDEAAAKELLHQDEFSITMALNAGTISDHMWTCDFSYDYVKINGSYRS